MKSLKTKLIIYFSTMFFLGVTILSFVVYENAKNILIDNQINNLEIISQEKANIVAEKINIEKEKIKILANEKVIKDPNISLEEKKKKLKEIIKNHGYVANGIFNKDGTNIEDSTHKISDREYFKKAIKGETFVSDMIVNKLDGAIILAFATPIKYNDKITGVLVVVRSAKQLSEIVLKKGVTENAYSKILDSKGTIVADKDIEKVLDKVNMLEIAKKDNLVELQGLLERAIVGENVSGEYTFENERKMLGFAPIEGTKWYFGEIVPRDELLSRLSIMEKTIIIISFVALFLIVITIYIIGNRMTKPIITVITYADKMSKRKFSDDIPPEYFKLKDETGRLAISMDKLMKNSRMLLRNISDISYQITDSAEKFSIASQQAEVSTEEVAKTIDEIAKGATAQAGDTEIGSENAYNLGKSIEQNQENMIKLNNSSDEVKILANEGTKEVENLIEKTENSKVVIEDIQSVIMETNRSAEKIGQASTMIASIAEQTNLLALNAAIEAARAGEAGRGFAVVAEEIRKLAEQSTKSTEEIDNIIREVVDNSNNAVNTMKIVSKITEEQMKSANDTAVKYNEISKAIASLEKVLSELNNSSEEMRENKNKISDIMRNLAAVAQQNAASTEEVAATSEEQATSMTRMTNLSKEFEKIAMYLQEIVSDFEL